MNTSVNNIVGIVVEGEYKVGDIIDLNKDIKVYQKDENVIVGIVVKMDTVNVGNFINIMNENMKRSTIARKIMEVWATSNGMNSEDVSIF